MAVDTTIKATSAAHPTNAAGICIIDAEVGDVITLTDTSSTNPPGGRQWAARFYASNINSPPAIVNSTAAVASFTVPQEGGFVIRLRRMLDVSTVQSEHFIFIGVPDVDGVIIPCAGLDADLINLSELVQELGWAGGDAVGTKLLEAAVRTTRDRALSFEEMFNVTGTDVDIGFPATTIDIGGGVAPISLRAPTITIKGASGGDYFYVLPDFASGGGLLLAGAPTATALIFGQLTPEDAGPNISIGTKVTAADGRPQEGSENNNDGLPIFLTMGGPGSGGSGDPGKPGSLIIGPDNYTKGDAGMIRTPNPQDWGDQLWGVENRAGNGIIRLFNLRAGDAFDIGEDELGDTTLKLAAGKGFSVTANSAGVFHVDEMAARFTIGGNIHELTDTALTFGGGFANIQFSDGAAGPIVFNQAVGGSADWLFISKADFTIEADATGTVALNVGTDVVFEANTSHVAIQNTNGDASLEFDSAPTATLYSDDVCVVHGNSELDLIGGSVTLSLQGTTADFGGALVESSGTWKYVERGVDSAGVTSSTTVVDDGVLQIAIAANEVLECEFMFAIQCSSAGGYRSTITAPAGASGTILGIFPQGWNSFGVELWVQTGSPNFTACLRVVVHNGATPGFVKLRYAQGVSDGTATVIKTGSYAKAWKRG